MAEKELGKIVGSENVLDGEEVLEAHSQDLSFAPRVRPRCVVRLRSVDEVPPLIKWANETLTPLVPVSSGAPHFRGDTVPSAGGAVIVDLSGLKKVIRADRRNRVAMIEPGVTFGELIPSLEKEGIRLNLPLLPRANKSVIGSMLEREPGIMPLYQWDAIDPLVCIEVIFGTGDLFRTGSAAGPGTLEQQWNAKQAQVNPMGPGQTDFARVVQGAQGTMGIVTWSTVKCDLIPSLQKPFLVGSPKPEKLSELVYRLMWLKIADECLLLNNADLAAILAKDVAEYNNLRNALPPWLLFFCLAGYEYFPEEKLAYQEKEMVAEAQRLGAEPASAIAGVSAYELLRMLAKPSDEPYWKLRYKGACQDIFFLTTLDRVPKFVDVMYGLAEQSGYPSSDVGMYVQPMVQGTSCHCEFNLFYDPNNKKEAARVQELYTQAAEALMNAGAFFSRPYGALTDMVYRRDGETTAALKKVKRIFDPNNIMNPGKLCF
jgi:FAD/FMN-containing dehydrogenase